MNPAKIALRKSSAAHPATVLPDRAKNQAWRTASPARCRRL
jgi:hypothetical protein